MSLKSTVHCHKCTWNFRARKSTSSVQIYIIFDILCWEEDSAAVLDSSGLQANAVLSKSKAPVKVPGKPQPVPPAMTRSATTFSKGSCSKPEHAHSRGEFPSSTSFPPQVIAGIPTTKSQRIPTENCSPTAQPSALQGPEQQDGVRSCRTRLGGSSLQAQTTALSKWKFFHVALEKQNLSGQRLI